jgi:prepilin-type N-terminal cleavage/methylation domain-containing protein
MNKPQTLTVSAALAPASRCDLPAGSDLGRGSAAIRQGFTMTELLVVLAVIGILVARLLPAISAAKRSAKEAACLNKLREVGVGFRLYQGDNQGGPLRISVKGSCGIPPDANSDESNWRFFDPAIGGAGPGAKSIQFVSASSPCPPRADSPCRRAPLIPLPQRTPNVPLSL